MIYGGNRLIMIQLLQLLPLTIHLDAQLVAALPVLPVLLDPVDIHPVCYLLGRGLGELTIQLVRVSPSRT